MHWFRAWFAKVTSHYLKQQQPNLMVSPGFNVLITAAETKEETWLFSSVLSILKAHYRVMRHLQLQRWPISWTVYVADKARSNLHITTNQGTKVFYIQGVVSIRKTVLPGMAIPMLKIRRPNGRLIFNMEIAIRRKDGLYIETGPRRPVMWEELSWYFILMGMEHWYLDYEYNSCSL